MNNLTQTRTEEETPSVTPKRADAKVVAVATALAVVVWAAAKVAGVELEVRSGSGTTQVALGSVIVTPLVVGAVAAALLRLLERRTANGLRTWTIIAVVAWVLSLLGPLSATSPGAGLVLATMHLAVGAVVVGGLRLARVA
jgi:hypothetical protein